MCDLSNDPIFGGLECNKVMVKRPTTPKWHCYTTLRCIHVYMFQAVTVFLILIFLKVV